MSCKYRVFSALVIFLGVASSSLAHVGVKPGELGVGSSQTFTVGVPVEKNLGTPAHPGRADICDAQRQGRLDS